MRLVLRASAAALALVLLAGCGGGSTSEADEPVKAETTTPAPPKDYTLKQLKAALPGKGDVADALKVTHVCPGEDKDFCGTPKEGKAASVDIQLTPVGAETNTQIEGAVNEAVTEDSVYVFAWRHDSAAEAEKSVVETQAEVEDYNGAYDVKEAKDGRFITPGEKGAGTVATLSIDGWDGVIGSRTGSFSFGDDGMQRQYTQLQVASGRTSISVSVGRQDKDQPAEYADTLARKLLTDYLTKLGR